MKTIPVKKYMRLAIKEAAVNLVSLDGGPFGACIVMGREIVALARNTVLKSNDPTAHAEVNAIRQACKKLKTYDLSGCVIYSTTEPCPMCFSAIHWARIGTVIYGTGIADAKKAGFNELCISNAKMKAVSKSKVTVFSGFLYDESVRLFQRWNRLEDRKSY